MILSALKSFGPDSKMGTGVQAIIRRIKKKKDCGSPSYQLVQRMKEST